MKLKNKRHIKILELIKAYDIDTQEALTEYLSAAGFDVTQATVSRDIRELHLLKVQTESGYRYEQRETVSHDTGLPGGVYNFVRENIVSVRLAQNIVVIKCYPGMADAVCASIDSEEKKYVVGSIAGDDTIFLAAEDNSSAEKLKKDIERNIG